MNVFPLPVSSYMATAFLSEWISFAAIRHPTLLSWYMPPVSLAQRSEIATTSSKIYLSSKLVLASFSAYSLSLSIHSASKTVLVYTFLVCFACSSWNLL